jgi:hypothetical protein
MAVIAPIKFGRYFVRSVSTKVLLAVLLTYGVGSRKLPFTVEISFDRSCDLSGLDPVGDGVRVETEAISVHDMGEVGGLFSQPLVQRLGVLAKDLGDLFDGEVAGVLPQD